MSSVKAILRPDKIKTNGEAPIYIRVITGRKPRYKSLGLSVEPKFWDDKKAQVKPNHPFSVHFNHVLNEKVYEVNKALLESMQSAASGTNALDIIRQNSTGLLSYCNSFLERRSKINKPGMVKRMNTVVAKVNDFLNGMDIPINSVDVRWLNGYEQYLLKTVKNSRNTIASNMSVIRSILNEAALEGYMKAANNPFNGFKIRKTKTDIEYLTDQELESVKNVVLTKNTKIDIHRNMYLFACYSAGIRIGDLLRMKWKHFDGQKLIFTTSKTGDQLNILVGNTALSILANLSTPREPENFIFGLLKDDTDLSDENAILRAVSSATAYANKNLRIIAQKAGIDKSIHFHTSRHTWATRMLRKGMSIQHVSKLLGHKSIVTTQIYTKIVNADLDLAMETYND